jgi:oligopeptidase B
MSVVHLKGITLDGTHPTYLKGYGSYGYSYPVSFQSSVVSLLDRGIIVALGHIRGGSEMGRHWYENGKFFHKKNTFHDFIACAEALIEKGYTQPQKLVVSGGSAGGLLIGATINARPELFKAALALVPFVDVATTMSDPSLPLTVTEYEEWGDPNKQDVFEYILSYSPYDQVNAKSYPALFVTAGLNDPRVAYWEPAKWVARLRDRKTSQTPVLFKIHMGAGHGGASGRYGYLDDLSWQYGFILGEMGLV